MRERVNRLFEQRLSSLNSRTALLEQRAEGGQGGPLAWAITNATIAHPVLGRIAFDPYPYQADFLQAWQEPRRLIVKSRRVGFSQVVSLEALYCALYEDDPTILFVSRSGALAIELLRYCYTTYNGLRSAPPLIKANESELGFGAGWYVSGAHYSGQAQGGRIKSIPANRTTGRGFTARRVYVDEFAYAPFAEDIYQSVSPIVAQGGYEVIGSTPNGTGNKFHELYETGEGFKRFSVPWYRCPAYNPEAYAVTSDKEAKRIGEQGEWFKRERPKYTSAQWAAEFECDFIGSGDAIFTIEMLAEALEHADDERKALPGHRHLTAVDVGRRGNAAVINTVDTTFKPYQRIAYDRIERASYPALQHMIASRLNAYPGELVVESNGTGDPVIENLSVPATPFLTTAKSKYNAIVALVWLLERKELKAVWTKQERHELLNYRWDDANLTQDCVMSLAILASQLVQPDDVTIAVGIV